MSTETWESAPGQSLRGLQLIAAGALASMVTSLALSVFSASAIKSSTGYDTWEAMKPVYDLTPWLYALLGLVTAAGWWMAGSLSKLGVWFRVIGAAMAASSLMQVATSVAMRRHWIEDIGGFYDWYRWVSWPLWIATTLGVAVALVVAGRHRVGRAGLLIAATAVVVGRSVLSMFWDGSGQFFFEHPWWRLVVDTGETVFYSIGIVLMADAVRTRYDNGGLGSFAIAAEGLSRYRSAISMRIVLAVSVIVMSFLAVSARSMVMVQVVLALSVVVGVGIAVHAARGLIGFARQPLDTGGSVTATAAAILTVGGLILTGVGLLDLPAFFDKGHDFREAATKVQAVGNFANTIGFGAVFCILFSVSRVSAHIGDQALRARAHGLMWLIALAAAAVIFLQQFGAAGLIRSAGSLIAAGVVVLVVAIVALVRYLGLLSSLAIKLEVDHGNEPPRATAVVVEE